MADKRINVLIVMRSMSHEEYEDYLASRCGATLTLGPRHDPTSTDCEEDKGHYDPLNKESKHVGINPFGEGMVRWRGGGSCAGDPLPYSDVEYFDPSAEKDK